jgi:hypothetical protein
VAPQHQRDTGRSGAGRGPRLNMKDFPSLH